MSFDFELALAIFEKMNPYERQAILTAGKVLMSASSSDGEACYAFAALTVSKINVESIDDPSAIIQTDTGEYKRQVQKRVRVTFECETKNFYGTLMQKTGEATPLVPQVSVENETEEEKIEKRFAKFIVKREERNIIV